MKKFVSLALMMVMGISSLSAFIAPNTQTHIKNRHWHGATKGAKTSHFRKSMTIKKLDRLAQTTIKKNPGRMQANGRKTHQYKFKKAIGTNSQGKKSRTLRVVTDQNNQIVTAFPV